MVIKSNTIANPRTVMIHSQHTSLTNVAMMCSFWFCNCVGFNNHKYFILIMFYLFLGCLYVAVMSFLPFRATTNFRVPWKEEVSRGTIIFTFTITVSVSCALSFMLFWHLYLVFSGQTTIEFYFNRYQIQQLKYRGELFENEYDLGSRKNFQLFFGGGKYWFSWLIPTTKPPPGDGINWIKRSNSIDSLSLNDHYV